MGRERNISMGCMRSVGMNLRLEWWDLGGGQDREGSLEEVTSELS